MKQKLNFALKPTLAWLRKKWWIPALLVGVGGMYALSNRPQPFAAELATVSRGEVRQFILEEGKSRLDQEYILTLPVAGEIPRLGLVVGDWVQQGQPILTLRRFAREQELAGLQAQQREIAARRRGIVTLQPVPEDEQIAHNRITEARNNLAITRQQRAAQEAELAQVERTLQRQENLHQAEALATDQLEQTRKQAEVLRHQIEQSQLQLENGRQEVANAEAALAKLGRSKRDQSYQNEVYTAQAQLLSTQQQLKQDELQRSVLRAPVSGPVLEVFAANAGLQAAGAQVLRLGDPSTLMVETDLLSEEIPAVKVGQHSEIIGKALGDKIVSGTVARIYPSGFTKLSALGVEQQRVKVLVSAPRLGLRPGTRVDVRIITAAKNQTLRIPERALFKQDGSWQVFKIGPDGKAQLQKVEVGLKNEDWAEIRQGLQAGDKIVAQLENTLKPGLLVHAKTPLAKPSSAKPSSAKP